MQKLFLDFESYYDGKIGYTLSKTSMVQYVRDGRFQAFGAGIAVEDGKIEWLTADELPHVFELMPWSETVVVGHNVKFDALILQEQFGAVAGQYICTKAMSKAVFAKSIKGHSLKDLAEHFGLEAKGIMKTEGLTELTKVQEGELAAYCLHDVELCREIYNRLAVDFPTSQYAPMHRTIEMFVDPKLVLNVDLLEKTSTEEALRRATIFEAIGIEKGIFASNAKFPELLKQRGFEVPTKPSPRTGKTIPALALGDPEFLEMTETENEELKTLCEARIAAKSTLLETRSAKLAAIGRTGNWPFDVEFSGADQTHRFSGGGGAGGNPQNFTRGSALRDAVEAPQGHSLVVGDFSNIELRIVAYLSKDPGLVQAIEQGVDLYCDFASVFYGRKITKNQGVERRFGKCAILGLGYGMGATKFAKTVRLQTGQTLSEEEAKKAVDLYRTRYGGVPKLWETLDNLIDRIATGESPESLFVWPLPGGVEYQAVVLPSGLKVRYPNLRQLREGRYTEWVYDVFNKRNLEQRKLYGGKLLENISQALAGELCKEAMLKMGHAVTGLVHDEIHVVCKRGLEVVTVQKLKRAMSVSPSWMPEIKLDAEVGWGKTWGGAK